MRTKCANCGMIYDIPIGDMDTRNMGEISQSGMCPGCGSNAHDPIPVRYSTTTGTYFEENQKK